VATIKYLRRHRLIERCAEMGEELHQRLQDLRSLPCVGDVRGRGLLAGIEFVEEKAGGRPFPPLVRFAESLAAIALDHGLIVWPNAGHLPDGTGDLAMLAPPFVIAEEQVDEMVRLFSRAVEETAAHVGAHR
jgi:adenosylmethionine-8-amino-7-oxononanoate aminotransferase